MAEVANIEATGLDLDAIRAQFPILHQEVNGHPLVYFDNAATTQKPKRVIQALVDYYEKDNANIHRGVHTLAERATTAFEVTRKSVQRFINAAEVEEVIFTKGTTDSINLVIAGYGRKFLNKGDEIIVSSLEHHSDLVPWQMLCEEKGAIIKVIPVDEHGDIDLAAYENLISEKTKFVSIGHVSNSLGTVNPIQKVVDIAHANGAKVLIDGAQAAAHIPIDVQSLSVDFYSFSAHKTYGPTGVGVLYGKRELLEAMNPYQGGGEMIKDVTFEKTTYNDIPYKFEAGTPNIAGVVAFNEAISFINEIGKETIHDHEMDLLQHADLALAQIPGFRFIGTAKEKAAVISFLIDGLHHYDIGMMLDARGIAVRTGHHCTQPLMDLFNIEGTARASFAVYNTKKEIDILVEALHRICSVMKVNK